MSTTLELPHVLDCTVSACSYNHSDACSAAAVTIGSTPDATCRTFIPLGVKGGLDRVTSFVGACSKADCSHNSQLECTAPSVCIGADTADCLTYSAR